MNCAFCAMATASPLAGAPAPIVVADSGVRRQMPNPSRHFVVHHADLGLASTPSVIINPRILRLQFSRALTYAQRNRWTRALSC